MIEDLLARDQGLRKRCAPVSELARTRGETAYLVGGTVRDLLRAVPSRPGDVDVALRGDAAAFGRALADALGAAYVPLAEERGTVRVVLADRTTYDITGFRGAIEGDLARRDFTVNAAALGPLGESPRLIDPFSGAADLRAGVLRSVSAQAFADDPLRTLRAFRFAATLRLEIEPVTRSQVREHAASLSLAAPERVARELFLMLAVPSSAECVRAADDAGVVAAALPETLPMRGVTQNEYHHLDVWDHSLETVRTLEALLAGLPEIAGPYAEDVAAFLGTETVEGRPRAALLKLAALLHDAGKPPARHEEAGKVTFYTHSRIGAGIARETAERLRLSTRECAELEVLVDRHLVPADLEASRPLSDKRLFRFFRRSGEEGVALLLLAAADGMATRGPASDPARTERMLRFASALIGEYYGRVRPRLETPPLITGRDLIDELGLEPGRLLGRLLDDVRERQLGGELATRDDALGHVRTVLQRAAR